MWSALNESLLGQIYISYRRQETAWPARQLYDELVEHFPAEHVVKDYTEPGVDFVERITAAVGSCDVLLALIGPQWLTITDDNGQRRLDNPEDYVRIEIETALTRKIRVIPILVDEAPMPRENQLPASLAALVRRNALEINPDTFDTQRLIATVRRTLEQELARRQQELASHYAQASAAADAEDWEQAVAKYSMVAKADPSYRDTNDRLAEARKQHQQLATLQVEAQPREPKIFLCYRREDTQGFARGIYGELASKYGPEQVFRDIDSTPAGVRFSKWIESRVSQCSVMVVLIGAAWSSALDRTGQRRLDLPKDWVREEIEAALKRDIPIIPVLVQGAPMPSEDELPPSIADVTGFQSAEITDSRWDFDVGQLIRAIDSLISSD